MLRPLLHRTLSSPIVMSSRGLKVGDSASDRRVFSKQEVAEFARLCGDSNPLHLDEEFAATTRFGRCIVHGILVASVFSKIMGTKLPGTGTIYVGQTLKFTSPCYVGEEVEATVRLKELNGRRAVFETRCFSVERGEMILDGESTNLVPKELLEKSD